MPRFVWIAILAFAPALERHPPAGCWGDVNSDAKVDIADAHQIARFAIGMRVLDTTAITARGDVTGDGAVNVTDAQQVARHSVGLPSASRLRASCP
jgi:hypothetical protein